MKNQLITLALPCYNAEKTIVDCIRSVLAQTYSCWELLVMDDGSTDDTLSLVLQFPDDRIRLHTDGQNRGRSHRLNQAARLAQGYYFARMDADDIMFPQRLEKQLNHLENNADIDLIGAGVVSIGNDLRCHGLRLAPEKVSDPYRILRGEVLYHPTVMGRTDWFCRNPYDENYRYSEDFALWAQSARQLKIANIQEPLLFYREKESFTYDKYRFRVRETRSALVGFGTIQIGFFKTLFLLVRLGVKRILYTLFHVARLWKYVLSWSNRSLTQKSAEQYENILAQVTGSIDGR